MGFAGKLNIYTCEKCRGHIVTRDVDEGVTPFMTQCRTQPVNCDGMMKSSMYRVFDQTMLESHQWYKPSADEVATLAPGRTQHVAMGGLLLRKRDAEAAP